MPPRAAQIGELGAGSRRPHSSVEQSTSESLPCISSNRGWAGGCPAAAAAAVVESAVCGEFWVSSSRARALSPSTFCVMSVKVASGAVRLRMDSIENLARATCAALGLAAKALDKRNAGMVDGSGSAPRVEISPIVAHFSRL